MVAGLLIAKGEAIEQVGVDAGADGREESLRGDATVLGGGVSDPGEGLRRVGWVVP